MSDVRRRRLASDYQRIFELAKASGGHLTIDQAFGTPAEEYIITYRCRSIERLESGRPIFRDLHRMRFQLTSEYPGSPPYIKVLTPIFHPHVWPNANNFCLLDHHKMKLYLVSEYLDRLVLRIGSMLQYDPQFIAEGSAANPVAMDWFRNNRHMLPLDKQTFTSSVDWQEASNISWTDLT